MVDRLLLALGVAVAVGAVLLLTRAPADPPRPRPAAAASEQCIPQAGDQMLADGALLHVPSRGQPATALVLAFHGAGGTGPGFAQYSRLSTTGDVHGFAVL